MWGCAKDVLTGIGQPVVSWLMYLVHAVVAFCNDLQKGVGFCFAFNER